MKLRNFVIGAAAALMTLVSCDQLGQNQQLGLPKVSLDSKQMDFDIKADDQVLKIVATRDWTVEITVDGEEQWVTVNPKEGKASAEEQTVTVSVFDNAGKDREAKIKFIAGGGMASATLNVYQKGPGGSATADIVYYNDFDKEKAEKGSSWATYLDKFDGWKNAIGTGAENCGFSANGMTARTNDTGHSAGQYSLYEGSGMNYLWFAKENHFAVTNIALDATKKNYTLSFGAERNLYGDNVDNTFVPEEFKVYISADAKKWVELQYAFPNGNQNRKWDLASSTFTLPEGTGTLNVCFTATLASAYLMDDLKIVVSETEGTVIDFSKGVDIELTGGSDTPSTPSEPQEVTIPEVTDLTNNTIAIVNGHIVGRYKSGFMMSDGTNNLLVYENDKPSTHPVGTKVTVKAAKSTYSGMAQLKDVEEITTDGTVEVNYPSPMEVTSENIDDLAGITTPTYVKYTGTLEKSGDFYNVLIEGSATIKGSVSYPDAAMVEKITPMVGTNVEITGYYIGLTNGKTVAGTMVIDIKSAGGEPVTPPVVEVPETTGKGTLESPYTPADALALVTAGAHTSAEVYISGKIVGTPDVSLQYGNAGYYISADGTETDKLQIYRGYYYNGDEFTAEDQIKEGDTVVILGKLDAYNGNPQVAQGSKIVSLNGMAAPEPPVVEVPETTGKGTLESPYTPADALALVNAGAHTSAEVYISGKIVGTPDVSLQYGNAGYYISADGTETDKLQIFRGNYYNGDEFTAEDQIKEGDTVVILGKLDAYNGNPQVAQGSKIITINGEGAPDAPPVEVPELGNPMVLDVNNLGTLLGVEFGKGSYGDYGEKVVSNTIGGVTFSASNICKNSKDGAVSGIGGVYDSQFIQMRREDTANPTKSGYITNTTAFPAKSIKISVLEAKDGLAVFVGTEANPTTAAAMTKTTEKITIKGYDKVDGVSTDSDKEVTLNVYTVDMTLNPTFFKFAATGTTWFYKIEIGY